jgi:5-methylcytosine-specific restriction enzyme subunit McrC
MIPILNIYYLLCYAWNTLEQRDLVNVSAGDSNELVDLFARVLIGGTNHVLKNGLDRGYQAFSEDVSCVRGRMDAVKTSRLIAFKQAKAHCHFDELTHDVIHNRILKTTIRDLAKTEGINSDLRSSLVRLYRQMDDVRECQLNRLVFRQVQLHRNNGFYRFLMNVCELINSALLVDEKTGDYRFRDFLRDENKMWQLFQDFIFNFYRVEQREFAVKSDNIQWDAICTDSASSDVLPGMTTDISLRSRRRTVIIDTKFYETSLQTFYGKKMIRSGHLYQIFAYLKNLERNGGNDANAEGILLYPTVTNTLNLRYRIQGHTIRVCTIDLSQQWQAIREDLLRLLFSVQAVAA